MDAVDAYEVDAVGSGHSGCSGIVVYGSRDIFWCKKVKPMDVVE